MNDVPNSQGYTQAAWWNRIPAKASVLMLSISVASNLLLGYGEHRTRTFLLWIMSVVVSIAFFLIADIDNPRLGLIRVLSKRLMAFADSIKPR